MNPNLNKSRFCISGLTSRRRNHGNGSVQGTFYLPHRRGVFALSALLELVGMTQPVPLFGEFRGGTAAPAYHLIYALLFLILAIGLWTAKPWGYHTIFIGGVLYTLDKLQFLMSGNITQEFVSMIFRGQEQLLQAVGRDMVMLSLTLVVIAFVLGWWGVCLLRIPAPVIFQRWEEISGTVSMVAVVVCALP